MAIVNYILRRAIRHWQLFLNLSLGVTLATALLASGPLLVDTVLEFGLRQRIMSAGVQDRNLRLQIYAPTEESIITELNTEVQAKLQGRLGDYLDQAILSVGSYWMVPWVEGEPAISDRVNLVLYEGITDRVEFLAGTWPMKRSTSTDTVPAVIGEAMALTYGLDVGERLPLSDRQDDPVPSTWLLVTGILRAQDPGDLYWFVESNPLLVQSDKQWSARYSAILPVETFYPSVAMLRPGADSRVTWDVQLAPDQITLARVPDLCGQLAALERDLYHDEEQFRMVTGLDELLSGFSTEAEAVRGPLYLLVSEIVLLVLYYVVMVATLSVKQAEREFAILRSRGISGWQIFTIQATEAGLIAAIALLSGPGLATLLLRGIAAFGPLVDVVPPDWTLHLTWNSRLAAGIGAAACIISLLLPVGPILRRSIVTYQQTVARPPQDPWWQRLYLDVILLVVGLVLLWRLHLYGGIVAGGSSRPRVDWLLLLSPVALLLGSATILLRVLPLVLRLVAHLTARGRGLVAALAMWQVSRNPTRVVLLVLLLTLATSLGMLSAGLNATLDVSELERAQYAVGGDMRVIPSYSVDLSALADEPGVRAATSVARDLGTIDLQSYRSYPRFEVLAIDPSMLADVGTFRDDFSDWPMGELLDRIVPDEHSQSSLLLLPGQPSSLGLWAWSPRDEDSPDYQHTTGYYVGDSDLDRIGLGAKLQTAQGEYFSVELELPDPSNCPLSCCVDCCPERAQTQVGGSDPCRWHYISGELPELAPTSYPLALHAIWIQNQARNRYGDVAVGTMEVALDDVSVIDGETGSVWVVESFEEHAREWHLNDTLSQAHRDEDAVAYTGEARQYLYLNFDRPGEWVGFKLASGVQQAEMPALASPAFLEAAHLTVGDTVSVWIRSTVIPIRVVGTVHYFPTMYENQENQTAEPVYLEAGFLVMSRDPLLERLNDNNLVPINAGEVWLSTDGPVSTGQVMAVAHTVDQIWSVESVRKEIKADPMALGLRGVTFLGYVLTSVLSIVGFVTHFYMSARRREVVYGVLGTMGLSSRQLYSALSLEQTALILSGLPLGTILGIILNSLVLPGLPITLGELPPIPPFRPHIDWVAVGRIYLILGGALLATLGVATMLLWRARLHRVLRIGEE